MDTPFFTGSKLVDPILNATHPREAMLTAEQMPHSLNSLSRRITGQNAMQLMSQIAAKDPD